MAARFASVGVGRAVDADVEVSMRNPPGISGRRRRLGFWRLGFWRLACGTGGLPLAIAVLLAGLAAAGVPAAEPAAADPTGPRVSFIHDVVPLLTKAGCNAGACHAKAITGQNGFRLSLLGFEPADDHEHIVHEGRGRRVSVAAPEESLLVLKATGRVPHGGGPRIAAGSAEHDLLRRWIAQGCPRELPGEPAIAGLEVEPAERIAAGGESFALRVLARYSDGSTRDVTAVALYEPSDAARLTIDERGHVRVLGIAGRAALMVRYQGLVTVATVNVPAGPPVAVPPARTVVDAHVFANLARLGIPPSPVCDDATFLRRVTLDITGALPTVNAVQAFLADTARVGPSGGDPSGADAVADRRQRVVDDLLASPGYADHFANKWTTLLKNRRDDATDVVPNFAFHAWIRDGLLANKPYDRFVRELLAATGDVVGNPPVAWYKRVTEPKDQMEDVSQLFLGVRIQCAQCHNHPFDRWSQDDYHGMAAFFAQVGRSFSGVRGQDLIFHRRGEAGFANPRSGATVRPAALGTSLGVIPPDDDPRLRLADWMAAADNPYFATTLVNRYWKHFFGQGLVEPEDDIRETNPASNPELLAALRDEFIGSGFDLKALVRLIVTSRTYQAAGAIPANAADRQNVSHAVPRRLSAEVLLDALDRVCETTTSFPNLPAGTPAIALPDASYTMSSPFLRVFGRPESLSACECERSQTASLAQSLHLMNAADLKAKLTSPQGRAARYAREPRPASVKIHELYVAALGREPRADELLVAETFLLDAGDAVQPAWEDLIWAVVNTKEFQFNH